MTRITSRPGNDWFALVRRLKEELTATPTLKLSPPSEMSTTDSSPSFHCYLDTGRNMPIWNSLLPEQRQQIWYGLSLFTLSSGMFIADSVGLRTRCCQHLSIRRPLDQLLFLQGGDFPRCRRHSRVSILELVSFLPCNRYQGSTDIIVVSKPHNAKSVDNSSLQ